MATKWLKIFMIYDLWIFMLGLMIHHKMWDTGGVQSHGGSPIAGWFMMENPIVRNGWSGGSPMTKRKPPYNHPISKYLKMGFHKICRVGLSENSVQQIHGLSFRRNRWDMPDMLEHTDFEQNKTQQTCGNLRTIETLESPHVNQQMLLCKKILGIV